jgi:alkanesulfonate monooxygenase SsuD/methylene tetrahydromethanopterin reductase-like flavin-dependent oxidoreductase (luciferase family)
MVPDVLAELLTWVPSARLPSAHLSRIDDHDASQSVRHREVAMPVTFGLQLQSFPDGPDTGLDVIEFYRRRVEALPPAFTTLWVSDHLQFSDVPSLEGWTRLTYLAALFPRFMVGHLVLSQGFRNPALVAKMGATLQYLSGGRFILGIGAGWHPEEWQAYGYDYPSPGARVEQLAEAIQLIRAMWTTSPATFHGAHYRIEHAYCEPRPDPVPPIMVGTMGKKALRVTARYADAWNWDAPMELYARGYYEFVRACAEVGRDPSTVTMLSSAEVDLPDDPGTFVPAAPLPDDMPWGLTAQPQLGPTPADAIAQLRDVIELGNVSHIAIAPSTQRTLERFCEEVVPALA